MSAAATRLLGRTHYGWVIVWLSFVVILVIAGVRATPGVLIVPLENEFHWSRATISLAVGINLLLYGAIGPFAAAIMDRFGVRRVMCIAVAAIALAVAVSPLMHNVWQLIALWGVINGLCCGAIGPYLAAYLSARWFVARQGLVVGILTAATAAGQLVFLPILADIVTLAGWRTMSLVLAAAVLGLLPLLALAMRDRPEDMGLGAYGDPRGPQPVAPIAGNPAAVAFRALGEGARLRDFWLISGGYFICGASTNGLIGTHLIPACVDHGLSEVAGAGLLAAAGVFSFIGGTLSGWLSDRWDNRYLLFWYYGLRGLSLMYLPFAFGMSFYGLTLFSIFYGLDWIASVPPTVRLLSRTVGAERTGIMVAWISVIHQVGGAGAAYLGGLLRIEYGSYLQAFMVSGLLCVVAAFMVLFIGAGRRRREPERMAAPAQ
jgi:sugar phosphate permease